MILRPLDDLLVSSKSILYSVQALENADQKNSDYGHLSHSGGHRSYGSQDINQPYVHSYVNILKKTESSLRSTIMEDFQNQEYRFAILKSRKSCQKKKKTDKSQLQRAILFFHKVIRMHCFWATRFFISKTFISNVKLELAKN